MDIVTNKKYKINVSDTGIGIWKDDLNKLFKAFSKLDLGELNNVNS